MQLYSYAKINLFLKITGASGDYHDLESAISFIDLKDKISITKSDNFSVLISGPYSNFLNSNNNILVDIFKFFKKKFNLKEEFKIELEKNIPIGGGLGGGSSNAAEFMKFINRNCRLNLSKKELINISFNFGSDIAIFLEGKSSIIKNRGEIYSGLKKFNNCEILLLNPGKLLSTKKIFTNYKNSKLNFSQRLPDQKLLTLNIKSLISLGNDLTQISIKFAPQIQEILSKLQELGATNANMSGSGSSCFGIFTKEKLENALSYFKENHPDFFSKKVKLLYSI